MKLDELIRIVLARSIDDRIELYAQLRATLKDHPSFSRRALERLLDERLKDCEDHPEDQSPWEEVRARAERLLRK